jgi:hypothetical protein
VNCNKEREIIVNLSINILMYGRFVRVQSKKVNQSHYRPGVAQRVP